MSWFFFCLCVWAKGDCGSVGVCQCVKRIVSAFADSYLRCKKWPSHQPSSISSSLKGGVTRIDSSRLHRSLWILLLFLYCVAYGSSSSVSRHFDCLVPWLNPPPLPPPPTSAVVRHPFRSSRSLWPTDGPGEARDLNAISCLHSILSIGKHLVPPLPQTSAKKNKKCTRDLMTNSFLPSFPAGCRHFLWPPQRKVKEVE